MEAEKIISKIKTPEKLKASDEMVLKSVAKRYPYFQAVQALHLKLLNQEDSFEFKKYLRYTALHTTNRGILFDYIKRDLNHQENMAIQISKHELPKTERTPTTTNYRDTYIEESSTKTIDSKTKRSFSEWLKLSKLKPLEIDHKGESETNKTKSPGEKDLIEIFIKNNPKIQKASKIPSTPSTPVRTKPSQQMMTETLAKIYLDQKKYSKAIEAYNILILNNPKKSGFFADQIKMIQSLQENN